MLVTISVPSGYFGKIKWMLSHLSMTTYGVLSRRNNSKDFEFMHSTEATTPF